VFASSKTTAPDTGIAIGSRVGVFTTVLYKGNRYLLYSGPVRPIGSIAYRVTILTTMTKT